MRQIDARAALLPLALVVAAGAAACEPPCDQDCDASDDAGVLGSPQDYTAGPADYDGFHASEAHPCDDDRAVRVLGTGTVPLAPAAGADGQPPEAATWLAEVTDNLIAEGAPINESGIGNSCIWDGQPTLYIVTDDWTQLDRLVGRLGDALVQSERAGAIEIRVQPLLVACADIGCGH